MTALSIGQLAKQVGLTVEAIRYYEKEGLIEEPRRSAGGYRQYPEDTLKRLRFIQHAKDVGFTLKDIGALLALRRERGTSCADIKLKAAHKVAEIDRKLRDLERIRIALLRMMQKCSGRGPAGQCPILEELELDEK